jgi:hypothetical protein
MSRLERSPVTVDINVRLSDTDVMNNNNAPGDATFGGLFGPRPPTEITVSGRPITIPGRETLSAMSPESLAGLMEAMLSARRRQGKAETANGERHADGSLRIPSLEAVWLMTRIGRALDQLRLVNLRDVPVSKLRSLNGLAELVLDAVQALEETA